MKLRKAAVEDARAVAALTAELGYTADTLAVTERLLQLAEQKDQIVFVVEEGGEVAGWIQAQASVVLEAGFRLEIVGLIVSDRFRRRGLGRLLVQAAESWGEERGVQAFSVRSNLQRTESPLFYPALGYEKIKTQAVYRKKAGPSRRIGGHS